MKKFNILDLFIVLFLVALVSFLGIRFVSGGVIINKSENFDNVVYKVIVRNIRDFSAEAIPSSGEVNNDAGFRLGEIIDKKVTPAKILLQTKDGSYDIVERSGRFDVEITLKSKGVQKDEGFFIEGKKNCVVGSELYIEADKILFNGEIVKMDVID